MTRHPAKWRPEALGCLLLRRWCCAVVAYLAALATAAGEEEALDKTDAGPKESCVFRVREQDEIWVVSTRHLGCPSGGKEDPAFQIWRYEKGWWQPRTAAEFYASDNAEVVTPFYIHGNRIDHPQACSDGLAVYFQLVGKLDEEPPVRFVIWSWPSSQIKGQLKDLRAKAARSDVDAYYLARFLAGMKPEVRVGLVGYSYGARIASGALHLLGGGDLLGWQLEPGERPKIRVALWAAAEHNHWYLSGNFHDQALATADAWFITINYCDPVLSRYRFLEECSDPVAVGYAGIYGRNLLPADVNDRIEEVNVTNIVGGTHAMEAYLYSLYIQRRTREYVLWHELPIASPTSAAALTAAK